MIQDLKGLMQSLPLYASKFMEMICAILNNYKETCYAAYKSKLCLLLQYFGMPWALDRGPMSETIVELLPWISHLIL